MEEKKEKKDFEYIKSLNELLKSDSLTADLQSAKTAMGSVLKKINERKQEEPAKITCPKCKKDIPLPGAKKAEDKKNAKQEGENADSAEKTPADAENTGADAENTGNETGNAEE